VSFAQLIAIKEQAKQMRAEDRANPLVDCPVCGHQLNENSRGAVDCPFAHFRQQGRARRMGQE